MIIFDYNFSGVKTPMGNLYTGALVVISLLFFTPYFSFIPRATLASVIVSAVIFMIEVKVIKPMWRSKSNEHDILFIILVVLLNAILLLN